MSKLRQRRLCSEHFDATAFASYRKSRLRKNACPTVLVTDPLVQGLVPPEFFGHGSESAAGCSSFVPSQPPQDAPQQQQMQGPHIAVPSPPQDAPQEQERQVPYIVPSTTPLGADLEEGVIGPHLVAPDDPQDEEAQGPHIGTPQRTSMGSTAAAVAGPSTSSTADRRATPKRQVEQQQIHKPKVAERIVHALVPHSEAHFCSSACTVQFLHLFVNVRLRWHIRLVNRDLLKKDARKTSEKRKRQTFST
ncbi:hypothetical protein ISCGN_009856 [Ixodes scapularis]